MSAPSSSTHDAEKCIVCGEPGKLAPDVVLCQDCYVECVAAVNEEDAVSDQEEAF